MQKLNTVQISPKSVRRALSGMLYAASHLSNPLENLALVKDVLFDPDLPDSPEIRRYALNDVLTAIITEKLMSHRRSSNLRTPGTNDPIEVVEAEIYLDAQTGNVELIGWSWLYYRYVRFDLDITPTKFCECAILDERTLRRYQENAIKRLTTRLIEQEKALNATLRKDRLYAQLPSVAPVRLFGRQTAFFNMDRMVKSDPPRHIQITGSEGVGKTVFTQEVLRKHIDAEQLDYLVWVDAPASVETIRQSMMTALLAERTGYSLREYAAKYELALVLDNVDNMRSSTPGFENLLADLSTEFVYIVNRTYVPLDNVRHHLYLAELNRNDAISLGGWMLRDHSHGNTSDLLSEVMDELWDNAGGNPKRIKRALHNLELEHDALDA